MDEREHKEACPQRCVKGSSMLSTPVSHSARLHDLRLTSNQVWGLARTDEEWSETLDTALTATRRDDLQHGTTPAYVRGCVCAECRSHQRVRMAKNR
jgi:hypothetical protein